MTMVPHNMVPHNKYFHSEFFVCVRVAHTATFLFLVNAKGYAMISQVEMNYVTKRLIFLRMRYNVFLLYVCCQL